MQFHPLADLFPLIEGAEFDELTASIKAHGLRDPITTYHDTILDGRNRYRACEKAGVDPRFEEFTGDDIHAFVADKNIHRRNLTAAQRGLVAARMATMRIGNPTMGKKMPITGIPVIAEISQSQAAKVLGVSVDTVQDAKVILEEGTADEIRSVELGESGVGPLADKIRARNPRDRREDMIGRPQAKSALMAATISARQTNAKLYADLKEAILRINNLPRPADMAVIARKVERGGLIDAKLFSTLQWLKEFAHEWSKRSEVTNQDADGGVRDGDAGASDGTSGEERS